MQGEPRLGAIPQPVEITEGRLTLNGDLTLPPGARGVVVFAHGSGSGRHSPRNRFVAEQLAGAGLATLLLDLLTPEEETIDQRTRHLRFDIDLLTDRLLTATYWLKDRPDTLDLNPGYFGASTGAAAALQAAARRPDLVDAVVSRGGRPDLAMALLHEVVAPVLLIVGSRDYQVLDLNRQALRRLSSVEKRLEIVPGASHLFEEPGALEQVAQVAANWFRTYLSRERSIRAA